MTEIRVLVVDGSDQTLRGLKKLVDVEADMSVVGTASSASEAVEILEEADPSVILMGGKLPDMTGIDATEALKQKNHYVQIVLLAVDPGFELMRKAMRARIRNVIPSPPEAQVLYDALRDANEHYTELKGKARPAVPSRRASEEKPRGHVVAIHSGKGGVGCTSIATNLAIKLQSESGPTILMDADLHQSDIAVFLNLEARYTISDLVPFNQNVDGPHLEEVLLQHESGLRVLAAPSSLIQAEAVSVDDLRMILGELRALCDWIVVDTDSHLSDITIAVIEESDLVLYVIAPDIPSVKTSTNFFEVVDLLGIPETRCALILNMEERKEGISAEDIEENLKRKIVCEIPFDRRAFLDSVNRGEPIVLEDKKSDITTSLSALEAKVQELIFDSEQVPTSQ